MTGIILALWQFIIICASLFNWVTTHFPKVGKSQKPLTVTSEILLCILTALTCAAHFTLHLSVMHCLNVFLRKVMHQNLDISYLIMSQLFVENPHIWVGWPHMTNALTEEKIDDGSIRR